MEQLIAQSLSRQNFNMMLLAIFAGVALLLAAIGIYGLISYSVEQRMQEIGIRVALGAARGDVSRLLESLLFGVKATDPMTFAGVAALVALVALGATFAPAHRAAAIAPSDALRHQYRSRGLLIFSVRSEEHTSELQ